MHWLDKSEAPAGLRTLEVVSKVRWFFLCRTPDKGGAEPGVRRTKGPELNGGGTAAGSGEAQPVGGRCSSVAFQITTTTKEVEAEVTTVGSSGGGRGENDKGKIRTGAQKKSNAAKGQKIKKWENIQRRKTCGKSAAKPAGVFLRGREWTPKHTCCVSKSMRRLGEVKAATAITATCNGNLRRFTCRSGPVLLRTVNTAPSKHSHQFVSNSQ